MNVRRADATASHYESPVQQYNGFNVPAAGSRLSTVFRLTRLRAPIETKSFSQTSRLDLHYYYYLLLLLLTARKGEVISICHLARSLFLIIQNTTCAFGSDGGYQVVSLMIDPPSPCTHRRDLATFRLAALITRKPFCVTDTNDSFPLCLARGNRLMSRTSLNVHRVRSPSPLALARKIAPAAAARKLRFVMLLVTASPCCPLPVSPLVLPRPRSRK